MVESGHTSPEQPEKSRDGLQTLRKALQTMYPRENIGLLRSMDVKAEEAAHVLTPLERRYLQAWLDFSIAHPDMTFDQFVEAIDIKARREEAKRNRMRHRHTIDTASLRQRDTMIIPPKTEENVARERQTVRHYLTQLFRSFFKKDQ